MPALFSLGQHSALIAVQECNRMSDGCLDDIGLVSQSGRPMRIVRRHKCGHGRDLIERWAERRSGTSDKL